MDSVITPEKANGSAKGFPCYILNICGREITYTFNDSETYRYFGKYIQPADRRQPHICVTEEDINEKRHLFGLSAKNSYVECQTIMVATGNYLLKYGCALFHCVSFIWRDLAWLLTAPSGTGKTTQMINWLKLYDEQTIVINGDKTGLECRESGTVYAYSSPWRGKESLGTRNQCAKIGGIILLKQGMENSICRLAPAEAVFPLFKEFISYPENKQQIMQQRDILERILDNLPVWEFVNLGDEASTVLLHNTLEVYMSSKKQQSEEYV